MSSPDDLTRWNRAGLARLRYVDGNAATYLEELRLALAARFGDWADLAVDVPAGETASRRLERLAEQYGGERRDWGWEIVRSLARACHVLSEHLDAYANEGFLGTATQWDNVRRLVAMLDYHPAPPASASTLLVLEAEEEGPGTVKQGFQVKHSPPDGGAAVIFETLADVEVDAELNELRLAGWNRSPQTFGQAEKLGEIPWIAPEDADVSAGQLGVAVRDSETPTAAAVHVAGVNEESRALTLSDVPLDWRDWTKGETKLLLAPAFIGRPRLNGDGVVTLEAAHGLAAGDVVAWEKGGKLPLPFGTRLAVGSWVFDTVREVDETSVRPEGETLPAAGTDLFRAFVIERPTEGDFLFPSTYRAAAYLSSDQVFELLEDEHWVEEEDPGTPGAKYRKLTLEVDELFVVPEDAGSVGQVAAAADGGYTFDGSPGELASGQWVVADDGQELRPLTIASISELEDRFSLTFEPAETELDELVRLYGLFAHTLYPEGYDRNETPLAGSRLPLDPESLTAIPELLTRGRTVILEQETSDGFTGALEAEVVEVAADDLVLEISPALEDDGFTYGNTVVRGNVVPAGHGESKPEKVLGSGDATRSSQSFVLAVEGVSFVADASRSAGVAADVEVEVAGQSWQQVDSLRDSAATDAHYALRMTEDGYLEVAFGDGTYGRRLPTGSNNVRVSYRVGAGLAGNLDAASLTKAVRPHWLVAAVRQPLPATGGADMESQESLREDAPASVLALERAVSLADFAHLASRQSSVWQARAFSHTGRGRRDRVEVVVVPAGGGSVGSLGETLEEYLEAHALPGIEVWVTAFQPRPIDLDVTVRIKTDAYEAAEVIEDVRQALLEAFALEQRKLGQDLFLSAVYQVVEGVSGVENSTCLIAGDAALRRREAKDCEVIYLDESGSGIALDYEEYQP